VAISKKQWLAVAREATAGTAQTTPTLYVPGKAKFKNVKKRIYTPEDRGTRDANYNVVDGVRHSTGDLSGAWYNDTSPYFLLGFMGGDTPSQPNVGTAPTVWSHAFACTDVPLPLDLWKSYDAAVYSLTYQVVEKFKLKWSAGDADKGLEYTANTMGHAFSKIVSPTFTPTYSVLNPFAGYTPVISLAGAQSLDVEEMEIDLEQKVELWYPSANSPDFATIYFGERTAKINYTARFDTDANFVKYTTSPGVDDHINIVFTGPLIAATYNHSFTLDFPIVGYDDIEMDDSKVNIKIKAKGTARPGAVANSLFTATIQNTIASYAV
jgi:hypothetical protein